MDWQATEWQPAMRTAFLELIRKPEAERDPAAIADSLQAAERYALRLDAALKGRDFISGTQFTMGDLVLGCAAHRWLGLPAERPATPHLSAWYRRLMMRPAVQGVLTLPLA